MAYQLTESFNQKTALVKAGRTSTEVTQSGGVCQMCAFWWIYHQHCGALGPFTIGKDTIEQKMSKWHTDSSNWVTRMNDAMLSFGFRLENRADNIGAGLLRNVSNTIHSTDVPYTMICIGDPSDYNHYLGVYKVPSSVKFCDYEYKMFDPNLGTFSCRKKSDLHSWFTYIHNRYAPQLANLGISEMKWHVANFADAGGRSRSSSVLVPM